MRVQFRPDANLPPTTKPIDTGIPDAELVSSDPATILGLLTNEAKERSQIHLSAVAEAMRRADPAASETDIADKLEQYRQTLPQWMVVIGGVELGVIVGVDGRMLPDAAEEALKRHTAGAAQDLDDDDDDHDGKTDRDEDIDADE
jgi:hypothetical protein